MWCSLQDPTKRLKELASEIETKYKVKTKCVEYDFGNEDPEKFKKLAKELEGLTITILVNNVGIASDYLKYFHEHDVEEMDKMVRINIEAPNHMTKLIIPQMMERKMGAIINLSSTSAEEGIATPLFSIYGASKAYNKKFSDTLSAEYKQYGIDVLCVHPGFVTSKMTRLRNPSLFVCDEVTLARCSLDKLGYYKSINPWYMHSLNALFLKISIFRGWTFRASLQIRDKAIRARQQKQPKYEKSD